MRLRAAPLVLGGIAALAAANIWLLSMVVAQIVVDDQAVADEARWVPRLAKLDAAETHATPAAAHQDILTHPVFAKSRAPFVAPPPPPPKPSPAAPVFTDPGFVLGGIMVDGEIRKAYLLQKANRNGTWVGEGDEFSGWKVQSITPDAAKLKRDSQIIEVRLYPER
jgi:hypothetical protein